MMGGGMTWWTSAMPSRVVIKKTIGREAKAKSAAPIIDSFMELREGWYYGEGQGATAAAVIVAKEVDALILKTDARTIEVYPCLDGGVVVYGFFKNQHVEVVCHPDGHRMELCHEIDNETIREEDSLSLDDVVDYLESLSWESKSHAYLDPTFTVMNWGASRAKPFKILTMVVGRHASVSGVPELSMGLSADTLMRVTTPISRDIHQFYGGSIQSNFPMEGRLSVPQRRETHAT